MRLPAGRVIGGICIVYVPATGCGPALQTNVPLTVLHTVHSPEATASSRSPLASTASISTSRRGLKAVCHNGWAGSTR